MVKYTGKKTENEFAINLTSSSVNIILLNNSFLKNKTIFIHSFVKVSQNDTKTLLIDIK